MPCRATQDGQVMVESSDKMWSTGEGNGKPLQYSCLENPMNSMKRQKDRALKDELPRSIGAQYAEMAGWHHWLDGHEFDQAPGVGAGQGGLACCDSWGRKESDMTERLIWSDWLFWCPIGCLHIRWMPHSPYYDLGIVVSLPVSWNYKGHLKCIMSKTELLISPSKICSFLSVPYFNKYQ